MPVLSNYKQNQTNHSAFGERVLSEGTFRAGIDETCRSRSKPGRNRWRWTGCISILVAKTTGGNRQI